MTGGANLPNSSRPPKPLHLDRLGTFTGFGDVELQLHLQHQLHRNPKGLFKAQGHFGREAGAAIEHGAKCRTPPRPEFPPPAPP